MAEPPEGYVAHRIADRLRVRIPPRRGDAAFFERTQKQLSEMPGAAAVEVNSATASILIRSADPMSLIERAQREGLFELRPRDEPEPAELPSMRYAREGIKTARLGLAGMARGRPSLGTLVFVGLVGSGVVQLARGQVLAPAASLFWYASNLLQMWGAALPQQAPTGSDSSADSSGSPA